MNADDQERKNAIEDIATDLDHWRKGIDNRLDVLEEKLAENTDATEGVKAQMQSVKDDTAELVQILNSWKGAMRVFDFVGKLAKPIGAVVTFCLALWAAWPAKK
jgi:hypothetical protein